MTIRDRAFCPLGLVVCALQLAACATVTRTEHADWKVDTLPQGAALASSDGSHCDATPCTLRVRRKDSFTATLTKDGYKPVTLDVKPGLTPAGDLAFAGNILIGGLIGMGVDLYTGAALEPMPSGKPVRLTPVSYASNQDPKSMFMPAPRSATGGMALAGAVDCPKDKASYAAFLGVPCASLGGQIVNMKPAPRRR